jgi:enamine deaminase RidA (YjgF/YER057c/UK114 family)
MDRPGHPEFPADRRINRAPNHQRTIAMGAEARIAELKLELPPAPKPVATYVTAIRHGDLLYVSGHGPYRTDGTLITGRLGEDLDIPAGQAAARQTGLAILATLRDHLGSLDKVVRLIKTLGMVSSTPAFHDHPRVINGYSDLMKEVFGDAGVGARSAVGMGALPGGIAVEIEAIFQVKD